MTINQTPSEKTKIDQKTQNRVLSDYDVLKLEVVLWCNVTKDIFKNSILVFKNLWFTYITSLSISNEPTNLKGESEKSNTTNF